MSKAIKVLVLLIVGTVSVISAPKKVKTLPISSHNLIEAYKANEISADDKFKDKLLEVTGKIRDIKKGLLGEYYVTLKSNKQFEFKSVQCFFSKEHKKKLMKLKKNQSITIIGKCTGLMGNVLIKESRFK